MCLIALAGPVPPAARPMDAFAGLEKCDVGNGDLAPEWGVEISIKGGIIAYGPWADRQRFVSRSSCLLLGCLRTSTLNCQRSPLV
jgi:hypothetical protein